MKCHALVFCLLLASVSAGNKFDDEIREFFEYIRQQMPCGFPSRGIPPLAPYKKDYVPFNFTNYGMDFGGYLTNLTIDGLNGFEIVDLSYATVLMKLRFDLSFAEIKILSKYYAKGGIKFLGLPIPLIGRGNMDAVLEEIRFKGNLWLRPIIPKGLEISKFKANLELGRVNSQVTGLMNSEAFSKIFNDWVEEFFRIIFEDYQTEINNAIGGFLVPHGNALLKDLSMAELMALILGFGPHSSDLPLCEVESNFN